MSTIRKTPYIESAVALLSDEQKTSLLSVLNTATPVSTQASFLSLTEGINPVIFTLPNGEVKNGILINTDDLVLLICYATSEQKLELIKLDPTNDTYEKVDEYLDINELRRVLGVSSLIDFLNVSNITQLTNDQINSLKAGDVVIKNTGEQKHAYVVSYKQDGTGICLTYTDASCAETVSYDYTEGNWVYNSTDVTYFTGGSSVEANPTGSATADLTKLDVEGTIYGINGLNYLTTAPSSANTSGQIKIVVLSSDPATKYDGYLYIITE